MGSLNRRLILAASVVLVACLGLTGAALDAAFRDNATALLRERLQAQLYAVLAAVQTDAAGHIEAVETPPEPRFSTPASGLFAELIDARGEPLWRSPSALGQRVDWPVPASPGVARFEERHAADGEAYFVLALSIDWESVDGRVTRHTVRIAERRVGHETRLAQFRRNLWGWFALAGVALMGAQALVLAWGLAPLRRLASEVRAVQAGEQRALGGVYPRELQPLAQSLNELIAVSGQRLDRYRHGLADLAHSLKTPLAVMRGALQGEPETLRRSVDEQVARMDRAVAYQLQRAAASGRPALGAPLAVAPLAQSVADSLAKVYAARALRIDTSGLDAACRFRGDEGDLLEIIGNLADNACKWAERRVALRVHGDGAGGLHLQVEDDGPGLGQAQLEALLPRGGRADPEVPGQGIGLAVVAELVRGTYGGTVQVERGALGGALLRVHLPAA